MTGSMFTLVNPGGLYGISVERLGIHRLTSARNRRLIEICKHVRTADGNVVEAIASGIPATLASLRDAGMPDPRFFDQGLMFTVTLDRTHTTDQVGPSSPRTRLTLAERELMTALVTQMDVHQLAAALGASVNATQKRLASLRAKGAVTMTGGSGRESTYAQTGA
jgi:ATP-dependent DNA helicase RecG